MLSLLNKATAAPAELNSVHERGRRDPVRPERKTAGCS
jgi:hypothetical protein